MSFVSDDTTHRAAKCYRCYCCGELIPVGESYIKRKGATHGDFWTMRMHQECRDFSLDNVNLDDFEITLPGEFFKRPMIAFDPSI